MKGKGCLLSFVGLILLIAAIRGGWQLYASMRYAPQTNPEPKYFMAIKGYIAPELAKTLNLEWMASYDSMNSKCDAYRSGWLETASVPKVKIISYNPKINQHGEYRLKIPIDAYKPGYCQWTPIKISYKLNYLGENDIVHFVKNLRKTVRIHAFSKISCIITHKTGQPTCKQIARKNFSNNLKVGVENYEYSLTIVNAR